MSAEQEAKGLRRWLAEGGDLGFCPDWYPYLRAARYGGVPLAPAATIADLPEWWIDRLLIAEAAEMEAEAMIKARQNYRPGGA